MRLFDRWIWLVLLGYVLYSALIQVDLDGPESVIAGVELDLPRTLPVVSLEGPSHRKGAAYIGTAFAVGSGGNWLSARHVTDGCYGLALKAVAGGRLLDIVDVEGNTLHRAADLALLEAPHPDAGALTVLARDRRELPARATGHGYPQGYSAFVPLRFLADIKVEDARSGTALGAVWHVERYPDLPMPYDLGGLSGGPLIGPDGVVRGIVVGSDPRRARLVTVDPIHARSLVDDELDLSAEAPPVLPPARRDALLETSGVVRLVDCRS